MAISVMGEDGREYTFPERTKEQLAIEYHNGFIPCPQCAKKLVQLGKTKEFLIKDRICYQPYPIDPYINEEVAEEIAASIEQTKYAG